jgi:hypothetical protein
MPDSTKVLESWKPEFRAAYDADDRNAAHQPFDEYWGWVTTFLAKGGAGQVGWLDQVEKALRRVHDEEATALLRERLHAIGKTIAAEWAKQGRHRRIYSTMLQGSPNLVDLGSRLQRAAAREEGDGAAIEDALDRIEKDVNAALRA